MKGQLDKRMIFERIVEWIKAKRLKERMG